MRKLLDDNPFYKEDSDNSENVIVSSKVYCKLAGITRRTFFNWKKEGKIQTKREKNDTKTYVILSKSSLLLLKKEMDNENVTKILYKEKLERTARELNAKLADVKNILDNVVKELKELYQ